MKKINIARCGSVLVLCLLVALPSFTQAYEKIGQSAKNLDSKSNLYTITYEFGFLNADSWMSIAPNKTVVISPSRTPEIAYELQNEDREKVSSGVASAVVLSDAEIKDGLYFVPAGNRAQFTLIVLHQPDIADLGDVQLQITELATIAKKNDKVSQISLTDEELEEYRTPSVR